MDLEEIAAQTMEDLWDLHQAVYRVIETNVEKARLDFGNLPHDPWFLSHYIRFLSCLELDALAASGFKIQRAKYAMSGIDLLYKSRRIKVWKATDGELPIPGQSPNRQAFMSQTLFSESELESISAGSRIELPVKFAILWDTDSNLNLSQMDLVCPKDFDNPWKSGNNYFKRAIPHPAANITPDEAFSESIEIEVEIDQRKVDSDGPGN